MNDTTLSDAGDVLWDSCSLKFNKIHSKTPGVNISTENRTLSGEKPIYVWQKLLHNGCSCLAWSKIKLSYRCPKTQKHSVRLCFSEYFYEHFKRQFTYVVFLIFKTIRCILVKRFYSNTTNTSLLFWPAWDSGSFENTWYVIT